MTKLYMFAIVPPPDLSAEIDIVRRAFKDEFGFEKALKPPVHITLFPPFSLSLAAANAFETHIQRLHSWTDLRSPLTIRLSNFSFFDNPRQPVVYIDVVKNPELTGLHTGFIRELGHYLEVAGNGQQFRPHITIGRDVTPAAFPQIKAAYSKRKFEAVFECHTIDLWEHRNGNWQTLQTFRLEGREEQLSLF